MLMRIVAVIFPIFAIIGLGYLYGRFKKPEMKFANQLNMDVFVPALVLSSLASKSIQLSTYSMLALGALAVVLGSGLLAYPVSRWLKQNPRAFIPPIMFNNSGNMGIPLALLAFGEAAVPAAVVMFMVENTLHYSLGTWALSRKSNPLHVLKEPVVIASMIGLTISFMEWSIWPPLSFAIKLTGDVSIPLLLFSLGVRLTQSAFGDFKMGVIAGVVCPLTGLLIAWPMAMLLPLSPEHQAMLIVFGALPPAVLNFVFAEKYNVEPSKVASMVMIGNLMSLIFVSLALYWVL